MGLRYGTWIWVLDMGLGYGTEMWDWYYGLGFGTWIWYWDMGLRYGTENKEFELCGGKLMLTVQKSTINSRI